MTATVEEVHLEKCTTNSSNIQCIYLCKEWKTCKIQMLEMELCRQVLLYLLQNPISSKIHLVHDWVMRQNIKVLLLKEGQI